MKRSILLAVALLSLLGAGSSWGAPGDVYSRAGKFEGYVVGEYGAVAIVPISAFQAGVGLGYNLIDQLNINAELAGGSIGAGVEDITVSTTLLSGHLGLDYNMLRRRMTPFLSVGGSLFYLPSASTTLHSANLGLGLRWDIDDFWFAKISYEPTLIMHSGIGGIPVQNFKLGIGVKF